MTEKNFLTKTLTDTVLSRRSFLKWSAALGGTAALAGGVNYGLKAAQAAASAATATDGQAAAPSAAPADQQAGVNLPLAPVGAATVLTGAALAGIWRRLRNKSGRRGQS